jgi:putative membrane protein
MLSALDELILKSVLTLLLAGLGAAYTLGWWRLRAAGHGQITATWRLPLYLAGLASVAIALLSPLERLAEELFSSHMIQHELLTMYAPPLLLLGNPLPVVLWGLPRRARRVAAGPLMRGRILRRALWSLTFLPVAWSLYTVDLWAWHLPVLYEAAIRNFELHVLEHAAFFTTAILFWWPIVEPAPRLRRRLNAGFKILYLLAATAQNTFLGMFLSVPQRALYQVYVERAAARGVDPVDDQTLAGGIMWASSHMYLLPILLLVWAYARAEVRESSSVA